MSEQEEKESESKKNEKEEKKIHRFSDFALDDEQPLDGEKVKIDHLLNKEITILRFKVRKSKFDKSPKCATVQFNEEGNKTKRIFFTGSVVIIDLLEKYKDKVPFVTTIKKIDRYYTLT